MSKFCVAKIEPNLGIFHANSRKEPVVSQTRLYIIGIIKYDSIFGPLNFHIIEV